MASWLLPVLKAVLPHVSDILSAAKPAFTRNKPESATPPAELVQQQISELQSTVAALEQAATVAEARLRRAVLLCAVAVALSAVSLFVALAALWLR